MALDRELRLTCTSRARIFSYSCIDARFDISICGEFVIPKRKVLARVRGGGFGVTILKSAFATSCFMSGLEGQTFGDARQLRI